jgi:hypothetical protein
VLPGLYCKSNAECSGNKSNETRSRDGYNRVQETTTTVLLLLQDEWLGWDVHGERKIGSGWPALLGQGTD